VNGQQELRLYPKFVEEKTGEGMNDTAALKHSVRGVIFDISGTVLDYGSYGPVVAFKELFSRYGITVSHEEARRPMGSHKTEHLRRVLAEPDVAAQWTKLHGSAPTEERIDELYREFTHVQLEVLKRHCDVIPGVPEVVAELRKRGIKIANTTGYESNMMTELIALAEEGGYTSDLWLCPDMVGKGRPAPWMAFHIAKAFDIYPMSAFVKVGDAPIDVAEAKSAGMWSVSVTRTGNEVGLTMAELAAMSDEAQQERIDAAKKRLEACGADYVIEGVAELLPVIDDINLRLARGEKP